MCSSKQNSDWKKKVLQRFIEVTETPQRTSAKSSRLTFISPSDSGPLDEVGQKVTETFKDQAWTVKAPLVSKPLTSLGQFEVPCGLSHVCVEEGTRQKQPGLQTHGTTRVSTGAGVTHRRHKRLGNTDWEIKHTRFQRRLQKTNKQTHKKSCSAQCPSNHR